MYFTSILLYLIFLFIKNSYALNCPDQQWIEDSLKKVHIPGAAILVVNTTHILYEKAFGYQSLSPQMPMDIEQSIFPIASISKTFVGIAVMQLVEKARVDLDTDINQYLSEPTRRIYHPKYPTHAITLRKLLSHSASIHVNSSVQDTYYRLGDDAFNESLADMCFKYVNPNTPYWLPMPPGSVTSYSNEGSALAALVVERVSNVSYIDYVKENILKPLGIDSTKVGVRISDFTNVDNLVKHYTYAFNSSYLEGWKQIMPQLDINQLPGELPTWLHISHFSFSAYPAGLLRMSARTLSIYLRMFLNDGAPIVTPRSIAEMRTVVGCGLIKPYNQPLSGNSTGRRPPSQYGLGWYWDTMSDGRRYIGHSGSMPGMIHLMLVNEKHNLGVILLSNGDVSAPTELSQQIAQIGESIHMQLFQCFDPDFPHTSNSPTLSTASLTIVIAMVFLFALHRE